MVLSFINDVSIERGQSSPAGVGEEWILAPIRRMAVVVRMVVVAVLLGIVFGCGEWMRCRMDGGERCICIIGMHRKSGVVCRSGEKQSDVVVTFHA